jgi:cell division protein FtsL
MLRIFNACLVITALVSAFILYSLEHATRRTEREIAKTEAAIAQERETINLLTAEWSNLTRPERLQKLSEQYLDLKKITADQFISERDIAARVPSEPQVKLEEKGKDTIGDILKAME